MINLGIVGALIAMVCWGSADFVQKTVLDRINVKQMLIWTAPLNILVIAVFFPFFWHPTSLAANSIIFSILTGIFNGLGITFFLVALSKEKLSLVTSIGSTYPVLTIILGIVILGERLSIIETAAIILVLVGVVAAGFVSESRKFHISSGMLPLVFSEIFWGFGFFFYKLSLPGLGWYGATLISTIFLGAIMFIYGLTKADFKEALRKKVLGTAFIGVILAMVGTLAYAFGISLERTSIVTPISALFPLTAIALGYFFLKEKLAIHQYAGIVAVLIGVIILSV